MMRLFVLCILLSQAVSSQCDTMVQSNWSGDSGVWGPVTSWGKDYLSTICLGGSQLELPLETYVKVISTQVNTPGSVAAGNLYTNGFADVAFFDYTSDEILWLKNLGSGEFVGPYQVAEGCYWVSRLLLCDLNSDGNQDIIGYSSDHNGVSWWENQLSWTEPWPEHLMASSYSPHSIKSFDIDADGDQDLIIAEILEDFVWLENTDGSGNSWISHTIATDSHRISDSSVTDMDNDGDADIVAVNYSSNGFLYWFENQDGSGTSWAMHSVGSGFYPHCVNTWDPDSDGDTDILVSESMDWTTVKWWENIGNEFWESHDVFSGAKSTESLHTGDVDGDGDTDFILSRYSKPVMWFCNTDGEGTMEGFEIDQPFGNPYYCAVADLNQDGYLEILPSVYDFNGIFYCNPGFSGRLTSSLLDTGSSGNWGMLYWESVPTEEGSISFQARSSQYPDSSWMGQWSEETTEPVDLSEILPQEDRYFQYRVILRTTTLDSSPVVSSVTMEHFTGIDPDDAHGSLSVEAISNPSPGSISLRVLSDTRGELHIGIMDISGRLVRTFSLSELPQGECSLTVEELPSGVYIVVAECVDDTSSIRVTVIR